jgi:hypothetical protein
MTHGLVGGRRLRRALAAVVSASFVLLALAACGDDQLRASDYDQTCSAAADCAPIQEGEASCCGFSECGDNAAISKSDFQQYLSDYRDAMSGCGVVDCPDIACPTPPVACVGGKCQLVKETPQPDGF